MASTKQNNIMEDLKEALQINQTIFENQKANHQLLIFNDNQKILFFGGCTFMLNNSAKRLTIQPNVEYIETIVISFIEKITRLKKLLIINQANKKHLILVFPKRRVCKEVFDEIQSKRSSQSDAFGQDDALALQRQFLHSLIEEIQTLELKKQQLQDYADVILKTLPTEKQENYQAIFNEFQMENIFKFSIDEVIFPFIDNNNNNDKENQNIENGNHNGASNVNIIERTSNAEILTVNPTTKKVQLKPKRSRSVTFSENVTIHRSNSPPSQTSHSSKHNNFQNVNETRDVAAAAPHSSDRVEPQFQRRRSQQSLNIDENEKIVQLENFEIKLIYRWGDQRKTLFVYLDDDKTMYYEYYLRSAGYICPKCSPKKTVTAKVILNRNNEPDFVLLSKIQHICEPQKIHQTMANFFSSD